jgi:Flp pilus assembly protein TadB
MKISVAEAIQIIFGAVQIFLAWISIRRQSIPQEPSKEGSNKVRKVTSFLNSIEWFDSFSFLVSIGSLLAAVFVKPDSLLPWAQILVSYFFVVLAATVFTLTVVSIQTKRFAKALEYTLNNLQIDGGEF